MSAQNKITILARSPLRLILGLVLWAVSAGPVWGDVGTSGALSSFSGEGRLREAIWRLAAFVPAASGESVSRTLTVDGLSGLPPVTITLVFDEVLNPWPEEVSLSFQAEDTRPAQRFTLTDKRPFGGANISLEGLPPQSGARQEAADAPRLFLDILNRLNDRLMAGRPRLAPVTWRENAPGFEAARTRLLYGARLGPGDLFLVRFDPERYTFRPYHENEYPGADQANINGWADRLKDAAALINSGQYYPDRAYMGLLFRDGRGLSAGPHSQWKGFLVAEPKDGVSPDLPWAAVIDQQVNPRGLSTDDYKNVMQSFMLLDQTGLIRVRDSRNLAGRAAIGEDIEGRIVLIMTPAAISLYDLAIALKTPELGLKKVMGLDGGFETQLLMRQNGTPFLTGGQFSITEKRAVYIPGYLPTLPAILAVEPRGPAAEETKGEGD